MTQALSTPSAFEKYLAERLQEPAVRAGFEDQSFLQRVIDHLVGFRKALGLTQTDVAKRMGVGQSTVSGFETELSDPRLSTLQRYARAVEARLEVNVVWDAECDWIGDHAVQDWASLVTQSAKHVEAAKGCPLTDSSGLFRWSHEPVFKQSYRSDFAHAA